MKKMMVLLMMMAGMLVCRAQTTGQETTAAPAEVFLSAPELAGASVGIAVLDAASGAMLIGRNETLTLVPASTQKLLVSAALLETLGPGHRFETRLTAEGAVDQEGVLHGNLRILGGGDPALASVRFADHYGNFMDTLAHAVATAGIRHIDGRVTGDGSLFGLPQIPDTWIWEDIGNYYGTPAFGLNLYENTYRLTFRSSLPGTLTQIASVDPRLPWLEFDNRVRAAANGRDNAYIYGSYLGSRRGIRGTIPANRMAFTIKGSIPDPAYLLAYELTGSLKKRGIAVSGDPESQYLPAPETNTQLLLTMASPPLQELNRELLQNSINLYAEDFLLQLALEQNRQPCVDTACAVLRDFWKQKGMNTGGLFLEDGSGLSRANGISAGQLAFVLQYMKNKSRYAAEFMAALPVAGVSGSLKYLGGATALENRFTAKSGYMSRVMNYAGYLKTASGRELIVVVMVNNYTCTNSRMRKLILDFLLGIQHGF